MARRWLLFGCVGSCHACLPSETVAQPHGISSLARPLGKCVCRHRQLLDIVSYRFVPTSKGQAIVLQRLCQAILAKLPSWHSNCFRYCRPLVYWASRRAALQECEYLHGNNIHTLTTFDFSPGLRVATKKIGGDIDFGSY